MNTSAVPFSELEFENRLTATKNSMLARGLDVLVVTEPSNMYYLTGYDAWSFYTPQAVLVAQDWSRPVALLRGQDVNGGKLTTFLNESEIIGYPDHYVQNPDVHFMEFVADYLKQYGQDKKVVGIEADSYFCSARSASVLTACLPDGSVKDADLLVNWVRSVKSDAEIAYMREAAKITEKTILQAIDKIQPGVRQADIAAEIYATQTAGVDGMAGEYSAIAPLMPTGVGTSCPHVMWRDGVFKNNTCTTVEVSGVRRRYHAPQTRTLFLGKPDDKVRRTTLAVMEGIEAVMRTAKEGVTAGEVSHAWNSTIEKHGVYKNSRCGYSIGIGYPPDWGERTISFRDIDKTVLTENVTMHFMPGIWFDDWGIAITESIRITKTGVECLCDTPRELYIKD